MQSALLILLVTIVRAQARYQHAYIYVHGLGEPDAFGCDITRSNLGHNRDTVKFLCPRAGCKENSVAWNVLGFIIDIINSFDEGACIPSWFDFTLLPEDAVLSPTPDANQAELEAATGRIEKMIEDLIAKGIPSQNIVLSGASQGGQVTLYQAMHSKHKLGAFVPWVTWYPNLPSNPPTATGSVNYDTPILQINADNFDFAVPSIAGHATRRAMKKHFRNYRYWDNEITTHLTTLNPITVREVSDWLKARNLLDFD